MNNFDDLFEQRPQAEAAPQKQKSQKERPKRQWWQVKEEKHRKEAYATLDKIFGEFSEGTGSMEAYLDVQSRFPFHAAILTPVCLARLQNDDGQTLLILQNLDPWACHSL